MSPPRAAVAEMISQPSMTWLLVTIWPSGATKKPVPMLASFFPGATGGGPPLRAFWMRLMRRFLIVAASLSDTTLPLQSPASLCDSVSVAVSWQ